MSHQKTSSSPPGRDDQGTFIPLIHNQKQLHIATSLHTKRKRPPQQPTLFQYLPQSFRHRYGNKSDDLCNELWGDNFTFKHPNTIRIWYTNPCGLGLNPTSTKSHNTFSFMYHRSQSDILSLAETNLRWPSLRNNSRLNHRVRSFFKNFYTSTSHNRHEDTGHLQRGGTCTIALNQVAHRAKRSGSDATGLGRWSWIQFEGKHGTFTRVITAYRPCKPSGITSLTTTWDQQARYLRLNSYTTDPRTQFDKDLKALLISWHEINIRVILCIDANDDVEKGKFKDMIDEIGLINAHTNLYDEHLPPTHDRGSRPISGIFITRTLEPMRAGILRNGVGILGDHRNMFVDFSEINFLGDELYTIQPPKMRRLQLFDCRIINRFKKACENHLRHNNILQIASTLVTNATYPPTDDYTSKMQKLDEQLGRAIACGDKQCRKLRTGTIPFSA